MITRRYALLAGLGFASTAGATAPHPLYFEPNRGQFGSGPSFCMDQKRWRASFEPKRIEITMKRLVGDGGGAPTHANLRNLELSLVEAGCPAPIGEDLRVGRSDYYFHGDPKTFINNVPHFYRLRYRNAWPNVDLLVRGFEGSLELSLAVASGAKASAVRLQWTKGEPLEARDGSLIVHAPWGVVRHVRPSGLAWRLEADGHVRLA